MGDDLNKRIAKAQAELDAQKRPSAMSTGAGASLGLRMASDMVAAVIVGVVLGVGIDALYHVSPWGLIVCLLLGFGTGVRNVVVAAMNANRANTGTDTKQGPQPGEGE